MITKKTATVLLIVLFFIPDNLPAIDFNFTLISIPNMSKKTQAWLALAAGITVGGLGGVATWYCYKKAKELEGFTDPDIVKKRKRYMMAAILLGTTSFAALTTGTIFGIHNFTAKDEPPEDDKSLFEEIKAGATGIGGKLKRKLSDAEDFVEDLVDDTVINPIEGLRKEIEEHLPDFMTGK